MIRAGGFDGFGKTRRGQFNWRLLGLRARFDGGLDGRGRIQLF